MILRVFRFDAKDDYELYYKPYEVEICDGDSLRDLLLKAAARDRYLPVIEGDFWLKIDDIVVNSSSLASRWVKDDEIVLRPLSERCAKRDFIMDDREFKAVYEYYFQPLFGDEQWEEYAALEHLFYATPARETKPEFMGDSALIFAARMMDKFADKRKLLLQVVHSEFGLRYAQDLRPFLAENAELFEGIKNKLKVEQ